jgi:hypothetical protein
MEMTLKELEARVKTLEKQVEQIQSQLPQQSQKEEPDYWWREKAGLFANDPIFDEIVRLGREYRESLHPDRKKKKAPLKKKTTSKKK